MRSQEEIFRDFVQHKTTSPEDVYARDRLKMEVLLGLKETLDVLIQAVNNNKSK